MNSDVDKYFENLQIWNNELSALRNIVKDCQLNEELKWGNPCYTYNGSNVIIISGFKKYCSIGFFKGALLKDSEKILMVAGANTQAVRVIRFTNKEDIIMLEKTIKAYIYEAIDIEKAGLKVKLKTTSEIKLPQELIVKFEEIPLFKKAFYRLTPGRQRAYILHFAAAKQSKTREARIDKYINQIFDGKGINDCTCGLSQKMPTCDGSHKKNKIL